MSEDELIMRRRHQLGVAVMGATVVLVVSYLVFVRTTGGQRWDDLAFDGRRIEDPQLTHLTNDALHDITRSSLALLTLALVLLALARGRARLAVAVGASVAASVVSAEILKHHVLRRPRLDEVAGIAENSFPSGHATIGTALALGLVMVTPHRSRWLALLAAVAISTVFGIGVLATGWHRPSDTLAAYAVCAVWFAVVTMVLLRRRAAAPTEFGEIEQRLSPPVVATAGVLTMAAVVTAFVLSLRHDGWRGVDASALYVAASVALIATSTAMIVGYHQLLRGISLDPPPPSTEPLPQRDVLIEH